MAEILTSHYAVAPGKYLGAIAISVIGKLWWLFIIPFAFFLASLYDWRWAVVGLIILMLVYPIALTTALLTDAMRPEVIRRASSRMATFDTNNRTLTIFKEQHSEDHTDESISYLPIETLEIIDVLPSRQLTKFIVRTSGNKDEKGRRIYDFVLLPAEEAAKYLNSLGSLE